MFVLSCERQKQAFCSTAQHRHHKDKRSGNFVHEACATISHLACMWEKMEKHEASADRPAGVKV